jgi:DNA-binding MarR family transcriptional regulator
VPSPAEPPAKGPENGVAFLLAQLGAHAAARYAEKVASLDLDPPETGVLHLLARSPGQSQQALAAQLGVAPSRVVGLVDGLESRGLIARRRSATDRRNYELNLTDDGQALLRRLRQVAKAHEVDVTAALGEDERARLAELLRRIADQQGLTPGVHPGYRRLPPRER